jgi:diadenosine tetraphosphate (Ap4A) HIT family hydrolase
MTQIGTRDEYKKILWDRKMIGREGCPFCDLEAQEDMILWKGKHWFIIQNKFPYTGTKEHIMAVPYEHHVCAHEFDTETWAEMEHVHAWVRDFYGEKGYFSFTRETVNDGDRDTRSIEHYHTHFCIGRLQGKYLRNMLQKQGFPVEQDL